MVVDCLSKAASQQPTAIKEAEEQLRSWEQQVLKLKGERLNLCKIVSCFDF